MTIGMTRTITVERELPALLMLFVSSTGPIARCPDSRILFTMGFVDTTRDEGDQEVIELSFVFFVSPHLLSTFVPRIRRPIPGKLRATPHVL